MPTPKKVALIVSKKRMGRGLPKGIEPSDIGYFLCDGYTEFSRARRKYAGRFDLRLAGDEFHRSIGEISATFLSLSHRINRRNDSYAFWGTHLASRNSGTIPLLKHIAYFHCAKKFLGRAGSRVVFVCDSLALVGLITEEVRARGWECRVALAPLERLKPLRCGLLLFLKGGYFLGSSLIVLFRSRLLKNKRIKAEPGKERAILRSWVTAASLDDQGRYRDRNFGALPAFLAEHGKEVWTIPLFFNLGRSVFAQMKCMSRTGVRFIFPEQYLSVLDILRTLRDGVRGLALDVRGCEFEGRDLARLIREMHRSVSFQPALLSYNSVLYLLGKFARKGISIDRFIYPIETNPPEKPFILAIRRYFPQAKIFGFQHTVWLKEQLGSVLLPEEISDHPLPDLIVCSGAKYPAVLRAAGFPSRMLIPGPNLRYTAVNEKPVVNRPDAVDGNRRVLIILNFETNQSLELLEKAGAALKGLEAVQIEVKAHPLTPVRRIEKFLREIAFPPYAWVGGTVQECLARAHVAIMTGASVSNLETMATGVLLIRISLENDFDFDCLWDEYPFSPFTSSSEEIRRDLEKALRMSGEERGRLIDFGRNLVKNYFEPVTPDNMGVFL
jgi:hypothetical protein